MRLPITLLAFSLLFTVSAFADDEPEKSSCSFLDYNCQKMEEQAAEKQAAEKREEELSSRVRARDAEAEQLRIKGEQERERAYQQKYKKERERIAQLDACEATPAYLLYAAQEAVIEDVEWQQNLKQSVARQKQLIKMSGVRNLSEERQIAEEQLEAQAALKEHWAEYKSAGGKAASPQAVKHKVEDPCDSFRPES